MFDSSGAKKRQALTIVRFDVTNSFNVSFSLCKSVIAMQDIKAHADKE